MFEEIKNWPRRYLLSVPIDFLRVMFDEQANAVDLTGVRTFCAFIGHSRSGHSLIASLLDAHRSMTFADEAHALKYAASGFSREQIMRLMLINSRRAAKKDRERAGYRFRVPGQFQGRFEKLLVVGDKDGSIAASQLQRNFKAFERLVKLFEREFKLLHIYRNPYDVISTMFLKATRRNPHDHLDRVISYYFKRCRGIELARSHVSAEIRLDVKLDDFILDTQVELRRICDFLGVSTPDDYVEACCSIVFEEPKRTRGQVPWTDVQVLDVLKRAAEYPYLSEYRF